MTTCQVCNATGGEGEAFCRSCGAPLTSPQTTPTPAVVLGPASDPGVTPPGGPTTVHGAPLGPGETPLVVTTTPSAGSAGNGRGATIAAIVGGAVAVLLLAALVTLLATRRSSDVAVTPLSSGPPSTAAPVSSSSPTAVAPASSTQIVLAPPSAITAGATASLAFAFTGDPAQVNQTVPVLNGAAGTPQGGYVNPLVVPTPLPGSVSVQVRLVMNDGTTVESAPQTLTIDAPPTTAAPSPAPTPAPAVAARCGNIAGIGSLTAYPNPRRYRVNPDVSLPIHNDANTTSCTWADIPTGETVPVFCTKLGEAVSGKWQPDDRYWLLVEWQGHIGFVTDEYVVTKSDIDNRSLIPWC